MKSYYRNNCGENLLNLNSDELIYNGCQHDSMTPWQQNFDNFLTFKEIKRYKNEVQNNQSNSMNYTTHKNIINNNIKFNRNIQNNNKYPKLSKQILQSIHYQKGESIQQFSLRINQKIESPKLLEFPLFQNSKIDLKLFKIKNKASIKLLTMKGDINPDSKNLLTQRPLSSCQTKTFPHLKKSTKLIPSHKKIQLKIDNSDLLQLPKKTDTVLEMPLSLSQQNESECMKKIKIYKTNCYKKKVSIASSSHDEWKKRQVILQKIKNFHNRSLK